MNTQHTGVCIDSFAPQHKLRLTQAKARKLIYSGTYLTRLFPGSAACVQSEDSKSPSPRTFVPGNFYWGVIWSTATQVRERLDSGFPDSCPMLCCSPLGLSRHRHTSMDLHARNQELGRKKPLLSWQLLAQRCSVAVNTCPTVTRIRAD